MMADLADAAAAVAVAAIGSGASSHLEIATSAGYVQAMDMTSGDG